MKKRYFIIGIAAAASLCMSMLSFAGTWALGTGDNAGRWWYDQGNGIYARNGWYWIDGNNDGIAENYYFDNEGWLVTSGLTPDQKTVNENGAQTENGIVLAKTLDSGADSYVVDGMGTLEPKVYDGIDFSTSNLGVSDMAIGSIMYPRSNTVTAQSILDRKQYYDTGTDSYWMDAAKQAAVDSFIAQWKAANISDGMSDDEKARAIYDWIVINVAYEDGAPNDQSSYGALIDRRCVCGGFTNAFMSLAKACGLDAKYLFTSNHAFNIVELDGKWYTVDATQKQYKDRSTTGVYYLHVRPEGVSTIDQEMSSTKQRYENRGNEIAKENARKEELAAEAVSAGNVLNVDDANLIPSVLEFLDANVIGRNGSQHMAMVLYTGGRELKEFDKLRFSYNGVSGELDDVIETLMIGRSVNGFVIGDTSSCNIVYKKNLREDGVTVYLTPWQDASGNLYVNLEFNVNPQR